MVGIKVNEVQSRLKIGVGRTLNDCFITKNKNVANNIKLPKIENVADIMKRREYFTNYSNKQGKKRKQSPLKYGELRNS